MTNTKLNSPIRLLRSLLTAAIVSLPLCVNAATVTYSFNLDGAQEVPPNGSPAAGSSQITIDDTLGSITFYSSVFNLTGDAVAAHLHVAPAGVDGPVVFDLAAAADFAGSVTIGPFVVPSSLGLAGVSKAIDTSLAGLINASPWLYYMNVHTTAFPGGEVRGQLAVASVPVPGAVYLLLPALAGLGFMRRRPS